MMPYINQTEKEDIDNGDFPISVGQLNYCITKLCDGFLNLGHKKYKDYNDVVGVLESAKLEFYRRMVVPYEDKKINENGDVYTV